MSVPSHMSRPWIDPDTIRNDLGDLADVALLTTTTASWQLADLVPPMTQVYGGAGRAYPVEPTWQSDPYKSPLRFAFDTDDGRRATSLLIADALGMVRTAAPTSHATDRSHVTGTVQGVVASRAVIHLDNGTMATALSPVPGVPAEAVFAKGMTVKGLFDPDTRRVDITNSITTPAMDYVDGEVVLAKVRSITTDLVSLALHPEAVIDVPRQAVTDNPLDSLDDLFSPDEVVTARVMRVGGKIALRLDNVDDDDTTSPAPSILPGGPPWLAPPELRGLRSGTITPAPARGEAATTPPHPVPTPRPGISATAALSLSLEEARAEITRLETELSRLASEIDPLQQENLILGRQVAGLTAERLNLLSKIENQKTEIRKRGVRAQRARSAEAPADPAPTYLDPERQLRHEIYLAWANRIPAGDKEANYLPQYTVHAGFVTSLDQLQTAPRAKVIDVIVDVLTGLAESLDSREMHRLRKHASGNSAIVTRPEDGAVCWRVSVQRNTPSAARLHFWRTNDGTVELSRVAVHDDMKP